MKLELPPEILRDELAAVVSIVDKAATNQMLEYVLVEQSGKHLRFSAWDGYATLDSYLPMTKDVKLTDGRAICLPARKTLELVKLMSGGTVVLEVAETGHVAVKHGKSKYRLLSLDGERYPKQTAEFDAAFTLPSDVLKQFIKLTRGFIGEDDSRFAFSGGLLEFGEGRIRMVGTDGARIAVAEYVHTDFDRIDKQSVLLPNKALNILAGMLKGKDGCKVAFSYDRNGHVAKAKFKIGRVFLTTNLTTGKFPEWEMMLPTSQVVCVKLDRVELLNSLKKSLVVSDIRNRFLEINFREDGVVIKTDNSDNGEDILAAEYRYGEPIDDRVGINADFVTQFLSVVPEVLEGNGVLLSFNGANSFIEINPESSECDFRYLVAPVRI